MFAHIFKYRLKCLLGDRVTIFWTFFFPLMLATLFYMAFANLNSSEVFHAINIAVIDDEQYQKDLFFKSVLTEVSRGDERLFNLTEASKEKAEKLLSDNAVQGYLVAGTPIKLVVNKPGISQNIIKSFIENYNQTSATVASILAENPQKQSELLLDLANTRTYLKEVSASRAKPNNILLYFYSLIAMSCFYGGFLGHREAMSIQANISSLAARVNVAPVHKLKAFIYSSCAALVIHLAELFVLLAYLYFVLKVDFGDRLALILLTVLIGSVAGLSFGAFVSALAKKSEGTTIGILIGSTMFCSFLAGMMYQNMNYIIKRNVPILSYINPVNLLTDAFYSLYYYDSLGRFSLNIGLMILFAVLTCSGTYFIIRRRKYASL